MAETDDRLRADHRCAPCVVCRRELVSGEAAVICEACESPHHAACWDGNNGCGNPHCIASPSVREAVPPPLPTRLCPECRTLMPKSASICRSCGYDLLLAANYLGRGEAPHAQTAMIQGIMGFVICAPILGPLAIINANKAKAAIQANPNLTGEGMATAGLVMGWIDIAFFLLGLLALL